MSAIAPALSAPSGLTILRCPRCAAAEPVDAAMLAREARMIRCSRCGETWPSRVGLPASMPETSGALIAYGKSGRDDRAAHIIADEPPPVPRRRPWRALFCAIAGLATLLIAGTLVAGREATVAALPDLAGLYATVGLAVHRDGLAVEAVEAERRFGDTGTAITVGGRIVNVSPDERVVPPLLIQFRDRGGIVLHGAKADAPVKRLAAGAAARFVVEVASVPKEAGQVLVRLEEAR